MKIISPFSGAGLLDAGLINAGNDVIFQCEKEPVQLKILHATFPNVIKHSDIPTLSKEVFDYYEIETKNCAFVGGAPCQKHSLATPRRNQQLASKLLAQLVRLTYTCRPRFVLVEKVPDSVKKCLQIIGNGVVYYVGLFIGKSLKLFNNYFYPQLARNPPLLPVAG